MTTGGAGGARAGGFTEFDVVVSRDDEMIGGPVPLRDGSGMGRGPRGPIPTTRRSITGSTRRRRGSSSRPGWRSRSGRNWGGRRDGGGRCGRRPAGGRDGGSREIELNINIFICNFLAMLRVTRMDEDDPAGDEGLAPEWAGGLGTTGRRGGGEHPRLSRCRLVLGRRQADPSDGQRVEHTNRFAHAGLVSHGPARRGDRRGGQAGRPGQRAIRG